MIDHNFGRRKSIAIKCDSCNTDLSDSGAMPAWFITIECEEMPSFSDGIYTVDVRPEFEGDRNFCNLKCLRNWCNGIPTQQAN